MCWTFWSFNALSSFWLVDVVSINIPSQVWNLRGDMTSCRGWMWKVFIYVPLVDTIRRFFWGFFCSCCFFFKINLVKTGITHPAGVWMYLSECCVLTLLCIYVDLLIFIHISSLNIKLTASIWFCGCNQQSQPKTTLACDCVAFLHFTLFCSPPAPEGNLSPWLLNPPEPFSR